MNETPTVAVLADLLTHGTLRAAINFGNPVLAQKNPKTGEAQGVSVDLATELARRLGAPLQTVTFDAAGKVVDALATAAWNIAFLAIDPLRANTIHFTAPYVIIEGTYIVPSASLLDRIDAFDRADIRIAVARGAAYDLALTRSLKSASLIRADTGVAALRLFVDQKLEAAAGVRQQLSAYAEAKPGHRVIDGRFVVIEQAMAIPKGRIAGAQFLRGFLEEMKASGFVAAALNRSGQFEATIAPPA
jgi:polar amino acid transport system substrate-binding protein